MTQLPERLYPDLEENLHPWKRTTPWRVRMRAAIRRSILRLFGHDADKQTFGEDTTCDVLCECGVLLWLGGEEAAWCPRCHRGYVVSFRVIEYPRFLHPGARNLTTHEQQEARTKAWMDEEARKFSAKWLADHGAKAAASPSAPDAE